MTDHRIPPIECAEVYLLSAMSQSAAVVLAVARAGPGLFTEQATRVIAAELVAGRGLPAWSPDPRTRQAVNKVAACEAAVDEAWGRHLVRLLAEERCGELLADQLAWADAVVRQRRAPLAYVRALVVQAFAIALGDAPLDPADGWEVAA